MSSHRRVQPALAASSGSGTEVDTQAEDADRICNSVLQGSALLVLGAVGSGKTTVAQQVKTMLAAYGYSSALVAYGGSAKTFLVKIATDLAITTTRPSGGQQTADELRDTIAQALRNNSEATLMVDDAQRLPASLRYWIQGLIEQGTPIVLFAAEPKREGIFLKIPRIEMSELPMELIRKIMYSEAQTHGVALEPALFAGLLSQAGGNPALAKRLVRERQIGAEQNTTDGTHYVDGTPFLIALLSMIGVVRFIGIGLGDRSLYVVGGIAASLAIAGRMLLLRSNRRANRL